MGQNVCKKMLGVCSPIIGGPQGVRSIAYFPEFILTFELFCSFRNGVLGASYLPVKIVFDPKTKRLHPKPTKDAKWIRVCGKKDKQCEKNCKDPREKKN